MRDSRSDAATVHLDFELLTSIYDSRQLEAVTAQPGRDDAPRLVTADTMTSCVVRLAHGATEAAISEMAERMRDAYRLWQESRWVRAMDRRYALQVRHWRVEERGSWRYVASRAYEAWGGKSDLRWRPHYSQLAGIVLCERAAELLGEDKSAPPWN